MKLLREPLFSHLVAFMGYLLLLLLVFPNYINDRPWALFTCSASHSIIAVILGIALLQEEKKSDEFRRKAFAHILAGLILACIAFGAFLLFLDNFTFGV